jgi:hypothetical protein
MENTNTTMNLIIKQMLDSDAIAYNKDYIAKSIDVNFGLFDNAYRETGKIYAKLKLAIQNNKCLDEYCTLENKRLIELQGAPRVSLDFMANLTGELQVTEEKNYDVNNDYSFIIANCIINKRPGFSKSDGYNVNLYLLEDGSQQIIFTGPGLKKDFIINSATLQSLLDSDTSLVVSTPDINKDMLRLLTEVGVFSEEFIDKEKQELLPNAKIKEEFILKDEEGKADYEIVDLGNGKGRNMLQFDMEKISQKADPFINAEVAGLLSSEQDAVAAWNVYIAKDTSYEEDDQMVQNANAGSSSWSYEKDLPLKQSNKVLLEQKYKVYFIQNYLKQFMTNQLPTVKEDAAVFDLEESKKAKAQKFLDDNELN